MKVVVFFFLKMMKHDERREELIKYKRKGFFFWISDANVQEKKKGKEEREKLRWGKWIKVEKGIKYDQDVVESREKSLNKNGTFADVDEESVGRPSTNELNVSGGGRRVPQGK